MNLELLVGDDPRFASTVLLVEANDFEQMALWQKYAKQSQSAPFPKYIDWREFRHSGHSKSKTFTVGYVNQLPVNVTLTWEILDGHLVCFYYAISRMVDWQMIEEALGKLFPNKKAKTDASNFFGGFNRAKELSKSSGVPAQKAAHESPKDGPNRPA